MTTEKAGASQSPRHQEFLNQMVRFDLRKADVVQIRRGKFHLRPFHTDKTLCGITTFTFLCIFAWEDTPDYALKCVKCDRLR